MTRRRTLLRAMCLLITGTPVLLARAGDGSDLQLPRSASVPGGVRLIALKTFRAAAGVSPPVSVRFPKVSTRPLPRSAALSSLIS